MLDNNPRYAGIRQDIPFQAAITSKNMQIVTLEACSGLIASSIKTLAIWFAGSLKILSTNTKHESLS